MIRAIRIRGLGPHVDTTLDLGGLDGCTLFGPSESGKSTVIDAVCWAIWGQDRTGRPLDLAAVRADADQVSVRLDLVSGTVIERTQRRSTAGGRGGVTRSLTAADGTVRALASDRDWFGAIGPLGEAVEALRCVVVPHAWRVLADGPGGSRPLRDLLAAVLPGGDLREIVGELLAERGHRLAHQQRLDLREAERARTDARRDRDRAAGAYESVRALLELAHSRHTPAPPTADVEAARALVVLGEEHARARVVWGAYEAARAERADAVARLEAWEEGMASLGPCPESDRSARVEQARREVEAAWCAVTRAGIARDAALDEVGDIRRRLAVTKGRLYLLEDGDGACPTCGTPGYAADLTDQRAASLAEMQRLTLEEREAGVRRDALIDALGDAIRAEAEARTRLSALLSEPDQVAAWHASQRSIGPRPTVPPHMPPPEPMPTAPDPAALDAARATVRECDEQVGASRQRERDILEGTRHVAHATQALEQAEQRAAYADALVDVLRVAPSVLAARQLGALGDLGPVTVDLPEGGGVDVRIDGRPWHLASTGRQIVGDIWLRAGIRRALGMDYLPLVVDCVQDVGGQEVPDPAPTIRLVTTDGHGLTSAALTATPEVP